ncbi:hypothetical protein GCM10007028_29380 [Algibacter mikhailovii]|uniref:Uncharacterized protein n=1 Tax=Algibacter mikhailovii TaxID=425498 RepID=A0A918R9E8_9FLAO|nr:hypothetical protein GCM10007028_29380 [Algibacter mikhailovii]
MFSAIIVAFCSRPGVPILKKNEASFNSIISFIFEIGNGRLLSLILKKYLTKKAFLKKNQNIFDLIENGL